MRSRKTKRPPRKTLRQLQSDSSRCKLASRRQRLVEEKGESVDEDEERRE